MKPFLSIWSKTPGTQVQHRLIEAAARRRNGGNTGFSRAPPSAVSPTFHNLPGVFDHVQVLDVLLAPTPFAPQPHRPAPPAIPPPTDMGDLRSLKTLSYINEFGTPYP